MQKRPGIFFLMLFILTAIAGFSARQAWPENTDIHKQDLVIKTFQLPHAELERPQTSTSVFGQSQGNRITNFSIQTTSPVIKIVFDTVTLVNANKKNLPFKEYLFHIYPFHNFW